MRECGSPKHTHLVAIDLPGFGHSQRSDALLSPRAMGDFVVRVADAFGLENPHVVGPDIGTGASLFAAALHPGRLRSLVVGSGGSAYPLLGGVLKDWVEAPDLESYRSADPRQIVAVALTADIERYALPDHVREDYFKRSEGGPAEPRDASSSSFAAARTPSRRRLPAKAGVCELRARRPLPVWCASDLPDRASVASMGNATRCCGPCSSALGPPHRADRGDRAQVLDQHAVDGESALA